MTLIISCLRATKQDHTTSATTQMDVNHLLSVTVFQANVCSSSEKDNLMGSSLRISRVSELLEMEGAPKKYFKAFFMHVCVT